MASSWAGHPRKKIHKLAPKYAAESWKASGERGKGVHAKGHAESWHSERHTESWNAKGHAEADGCPCCCKAGQGCSFC